MSKHIPKHIVLFTDGNRRWAKNNQKSSFEGHYSGYEKVIEICEWCKVRGVKMLTAFGFSTENWGRSTEEVAYLMDLLEKGLLLALDKFQKDGVRVTIIGQKDRVPQSLQDAIKKVESETANNSNLHLNLAVSYGGRWDIIQAAQRIIQEKIPAENITEELFESYLSTAGFPTPDFVIRPGGEVRLSNFLLWQMAYSEFYFSPKLLPDFTEADLDIALEEFDQRQRRYGK